ncbi:MAG: outer membrane protein assembly factor BamE [Pseudomonadota bacterium]
MGRLLNPMMRVAMVLVMLVGLSACAATFRNYGYIPDDADLEALVVGVDTRDSVETAVGRPQASGVINDTAWYYVRSRVRFFGPRKPQVVERQLLAVSFAEDGTVSNIERFGLEDGRVVTLSRRVTETSIREFGLIQQIIRNFGRINVGDAIANN